MFRYHDIRAYGFCKLPKSFCSSTSILNIQNYDNYCFLWPILAHKHKIDNPHKKVSHYKKHFHELNQSDNQFSIKIKDIPTFERLKNLNMFLSYQLMTKLFHPNMLIKTIMMNR